MKNILPPDYTYTPPLKTSHFTERTLFFDKEYIIVRQSNYRSSGSNEFTITENTVETKRIVYHPRYCLIIIVILLFSILGALLLKDILFSSTANPETKSTLSSDDEPEVTVESITPSSIPLTSTEEILTYITNYIPLKNGMVFSMSSSEKISSEQVNEIMTKYSVEISTVLIRAAINEVYARHGYVFSKSHWKTYYSQQAWYIPNPQASIDFSTFNETERSNLYYLLQIEESLNQKRYTTQ